MNRLQRALGVGALVLASAGCEQREPEYSIGAVVKERGTVAQIVESNGAIFGNESVKISDPTYVLQIQFPQGLYTVSVDESWDKPLEALALGIEEGGQVKVQERLLNSRSRFGEDKIGKLYSNEIIVLYSEDTVVK